MTGSLFVQTLVFTWMHSPQASLSDFVLTARSLGLSITPQAFALRFNESSSILLKSLLEEASRCIIAQNVSLPPLFVRFNGVYLQDSSTLPS